jgi:hypothetical protein
MIALQIGNNNQISSIDNQHKLNITNGQLVNYPHSFSIKTKKGSGPYIEINEDNFFFIDSDGKHIVPQNPFIIGIDKNNKNHLIQYAIFRLDGLHISDSDKELLKEYKVRGNNDNEIICRYTSGEITFTLDNNKVTGVYVNNSNVLTEDLIIVIVKHDDNTKPIIIPLRSYIIPFNQNKQSEFISKIKEKTNKEIDSNGVDFTSNFKTLKKTSIITKVKLKYEDDTIKIKSEAQYKDKGKNNKGSKLKVFTVNNNILDTFNKPVFVVSEIQSITFDDEILYIALFPTGIRFFGEGNKFIVNDDNNQYQMQDGWHLYILETRFDQFIFSESDIAKKEVISGIIGMRYLDLFYSDSALTGFVGFNFNTKIDNQDTTITISKGGSTFEIAPLNTKDFKFGRMYNNGFSTYIELQANNE